MKQSLLTLALILALVTSAEARKRAATYTDEHGVKRKVKTGEIYRDYAAVREFKKKNPKPNDGRAYDVDHKKPLSKGGADKPSNMQWLPTEEHRRKTAGEK